MAALPELINPVIAAIDAAWEQEAERTARDGNSIPAGQIGEPCERRLWLAWRWAHEREKFSGRMLRLFDVGHREEEALILSLKRAGVSVSERVPITQEYLAGEGKQHRVTFANGHGNGYLDGICDNVPGAPKTAHLLECKTHNDKSFQQLKKHSDVSVSHPKHWVQMQIYMHLRGLTRALYLAKNKNDDELYVERVHYDEPASLRLVAKAERIVKSNEPPPRISEDPNSFACKFCPAKALCHQADGQTWARANCRTCLYSTPVDGGKWECGLLVKNLTIDEQRAGCEAHLYIPGLVFGEQIDTNEQKNTVTYRLPDGSEYVDGLSPKATPPNQAGSGAS